MASDRRYEMDELLARPGTYFNPQTEVLVVVDDSSSMDSEIFNMEEFEGADWVLVADDLPIDEAKRDELLEDFQAGARAGDEGSAGGLVDPEAAANAGDAQDVEPPPAVVPLDDDDE